MIYANLWRRVICSSATSQIPYGHFFSLKIGVVGQICMHLRYKWPRTKTLEREARDLKDGGNVGSPQKLKAAGSAEIGKN